MIHTYTYVLPFFYTHTYIHTYIRRERDRERERETPASEVACASERGKIEVWDQGGGEGGGLTIRTDSARAGFSLSAALFRCTATWLRVEAQG
jgi:hypothetical protein